MLCVSLCASNRILLKRQFHERLEPVKMWIQLLQINPTSVLLQVGNEKITLTEEVRRPITFAGTTVMLHYRTRNARRIAFKIQAPLSVEIIRERLVVKEI
jgi:hypothetical protein